MKVVEISEETSLDIENIFNTASEENIIVKFPDGREFVLAEIDSFDKEIELVRENKELMELLAIRSKEEKTYTLEQVKKQLGI